MQSKDKIYNTILKDIEGTVIKQLEVNKESKMRTKLDGQYQKIEREKTLIKQNEEIKILLAKTLEVLGKIEQNSQDKISLPKQYEVVVQNPVQVSNLKEIQIPKPLKTVELKQTKWLVDLFGIVTEPLIQIYKQLKGIRYDGRGFKFGKKV